MSSWNPILALAERALQEQFIRERLDQESDALLAQGVSNQDVYEALQTIWAPGCPIPLVEMVALMCVRILSAAGHDALVAAMHIHVGNVLSERDDRPSLSLAIQHYQAARQWLDQPSPGYDQAQRNEGNAQQALERLGEDSIAKRRRAVGLYEEAAKLREPSSFDRERLEKEYQLYKEGLQIEERVRAQMPWDPARFPLLMAPPYSFIVRVSIELADSAATLEEKDRWRWKAWHWVQAGKSHASLKRLANVRSRRKNTARPQWERDQQLTQASDKPERDIQYLPHHRLTDPSGVRPEHIEEAWILPPVEVPPPTQVVESLRQLAGLRPSPQATAAQGICEKPVTRKPLVVDFFMLCDGDMAVFLLPLWQDTAPIIHRIKKAHETIPQMAGSLLEALATLQPLTRAGPQGPTREASPAARRAARKVFDRLPAELSVLLEPWMPAVAHSQATELVLSPHFLLNLLPLHAALWQGKPLIEHYPIVYLPSAALAPEVLRSCKPVGGEALLLGNPTEDLNGAEREIDRVERWLAHRGMQCHVARRCEATTSYVHTHASGAGIIHFACHSVLDFADFLRSGVKLADGLLTLEDMATRLELAQAALVYLSSCDTAQAVIGRTDELMALVQVFLYAGSPTVIASLWGLADGPGAKFADYFYKSWVGEGQPLAVAFRQAMLQHKKAYPNPFYWAPMVLMGAWHTQVW